MGVGDRLGAEKGTYTGKLLHVLAGRRLSLQYHDEKTETQCLLSGRAILVLEDASGALQEIAMKPGKDILSTRTRRTE